MCRSRPPYNSADSNLAYRVGRAARRRLASAGARSGLSCLTTSIRGMSKSSERRAIANLVGIPDPGDGVGSSIYKALFNGVCDRLGIDASGSMPQQAQRIVTAANLPYRADMFDSRETPSGGGSTVTLEGLQQIRKAVEILLS